MQTSLRAAGRLAFSALLVVATATCTDQPTEPGGGHAAQVRFTPVFASHSFFAGLPLDNITVTVVRPPAETLVVQNAPFAVTDSVLQLDVAVTLNAPSESLEVTLDLLSGTSLLFRGQDTLLVAAGTGTSAPPIALTYVGPGANIAFLSIAPRDTILSFGDTLIYGASASDALENPVGTFYLHWYTTPAGAPIRSDGRLIAPASRNTIMVHAWTPSGVEDSTSVTFMPVPTQLIKIAGDLQSDTVGQTLPQVFVVEVRAADNLAVAGVPVVFAGVTANDSIVVIQGVTDINGDATAYGVLGLTAGSYNWTATVAGVAPVTFQATANAGPAAAIAKVSGDAQSDTAGQTLQQPLVVRVADAGDNPVAGAMVIWSRVTGSGTPTLDTVLTDGAGHAQLVYTLGASGTDSIRATLAGTGAFVDFTATATVGAVKVVVISGDLQTDTVTHLLSAPLVIETQGVGGSTPVPGVQVTWVINVGTGVLSADTTVTDSLGRSSVTLTFGTVAGDVEALVDAHLGGSLGVFHFTAVAAAPHHLAFLVLPPDTVQVDVALAPPPAVQVRDSFDNVVPVAGRKIRASTPFVAAAPPMRASGIQFSASVSAGDSAVTDSTGTATFSGLALSGSVGGEELDFTVDSLGLATLFDSVYVTPGLPSTVIPYNGNGQTAFVDSLVPIAPQALVVDAGGNGVKGVTVVFVVTAGGGVVTGDTVVTDSLGYATVGSWRMGSSPGTNTLEARVTGASTAVFTANGQPLTPTILLQLLGTTVVGVGRTAPLEVRLSSPAPLGGVDVSVVSDAPGSVDVQTPTLTFAQGDSILIDSLVGVAVGAANITASGAGYIPDTLVVAGSLNLISLPTTLNVPFGGTASIAVTLGQPAPPGGTVVSLVSSDPSLVGIVTPTVSIPQGSTSANGTVQGVALGTVTVTASNPNYAPDQSTVSTSATLNIVTASQTVYSTIPVTQTLEFRSAGALIAAPGGGLVVTLTARDTACVAVPPTVTIPGGLSSTTFMPTYSGPAPLPCATQVVASYPGVNADSIALTVNPPPISTLTAADVGSGLATYAYGYLETGVPTVRNMVIRSLDPTKVLVAVIDTAVGADSAVFPLGVGETFRYYYIRGKEGIVNDSAQVELSAPGYLTDTAWVRVRAPGVVLGSFPATTTSLSAPSAMSAYVGLPNAAFTGIQAYQGLRPGGTLGDSIIFTLTPTPDSAARLMKADSIQDTVRTATLVPGQYYTGNLAQGGVQYVPHTAGTSTLTVAAPGYLTLSVPGTTTISAPISTLTASDVGSGMATYAYGYLETGVPTARNLTITSLDTTKVLVATADTAVGGESAVFPLAVGETFRYYYIRGKEGIVNDSAQVELSALGYLTDTAWVRVRAPGVVLGSFPATTTSLSAPSAVTAYVGLPNVANTAIAAYQGLRPGGTLGNLVTFTLTDTVVADTLALLMKADSVQDPVRTATLVPGQYYTGNLAQGGVVYVPRAAGTTTLSAAAAGYITLPAATGTTTITSPGSTLTATDVGSGLATYAYGYLETGVPSPRNLTITSLDTTKVLVATADTAVGGESAVFPLAVGETFRYYYIRGVEGIVNDSAQVQLSAPGYATSTAWVRVRQPGVVLGSFPATATTLSPPTAVTAYVGLPNVANTAITAYQGRRPGGTLDSVITFTLTPSGLAALFKADSVQDTVRTATLVPLQYYTGNLAQGGVQYLALATGTTTLSVAATGYVTLPGATGTTTISTPGISLGSPGTVGAGLQNYGYFSLGASQHGGDSVWIKSSNPSVALVAPNNTTPGTDSVAIFIPNGQTFSYFYVQGVDSAAGTPIITVSANGFVDATIGVPIVQPGVTIANVPASMATAAADQVIYAYIGVPNVSNTGLNATQERRAGGAPLTVTFTSGNPAAATLVNSGGPGTPLTATITAGNYNSPTSVGAGGVAVRPVAPGSSAISVALPGFIPQSTATATVNVTP